MFQNFKKVPGTPKFPNFPKVRPYVLEKSRPLGLGILEILDFLEIPKFPKVRPYVLERSRPLRLGILDILEILEILKFWKLYGNFGILGIDFQEG